jgi:hypothetical protein
MRIPVQLSSTMMHETTVSIVTCLVITKFLLAVWALLSAVEWLANLSLFRSDGLLSWDLLKLRPGLAGSAGTGYLLYSDIALMLVICGRAIAGAVLMIPSVNWWDIPCSGFILLSCFYVSRRAVFGSDGSDQMGMVVAAGVTLLSAGLALNDSGLVFCGVLAIAGQATLAYFIAGAAKLLSPTWRGGQAIPKVMNTRSYGHPVAAKIAGNSSALSRSLCWVVILTEMLFPLIFLLPWSMAIACLAGFAVFHFCNAYFMGLNGFVWPFLATYPSVMLLNVTIRSALGWI